MIQGYKIMTNDPRIFVVKPHLGVVNINGRVSISISLMYNSTLNDDHMHTKKIAVYIYSQVDDWIDGDLNTLMKNNSSRVERHEYKV